MVAVSVGGSGKRPRKAVYVGQKLRSPDRAAAPDRDQVIGIARQELRGWVRQTRWLSTC